MFQYGARQCSAVPAPLLSPEISHYHTITGVVFDDLDLQQVSLLGLLGPELQDLLLFLSEVIELIVMNESAMNVNGLLMDPVVTLMMIIPQTIALVNTLIDQILAQLNIDAVYDDWS